MSADHNTQPAVADQAAFERAWAKSGMTKFKDTAEWAWHAVLADRASRTEATQEPVDVEYEWLVDDEWQGSATSAREALRYVEQYRADGAITVRRVERYEMTEVELRAIAASKEAA